MKRKHLMRVISCITAAALLLPLALLGVSAADTDKSGVCGPYLYWDFVKETGTLTINGEGPMYSYRNARNKEYSPPWYGLGVRKVVIEEGATTVGDYAFSYLSAACEFVFPEESLVKIGSYAFSFCSSVDKIVLPDSVIEIGKEAFGRCTSLVSLDLGDGLVETSTDMCYGLPELRSVKIGKGCKIIGTNSFYECEKLFDIDLSGVEEVGIQSFYKCSSLKEVHLGENLKRVCSNAFGYCTSLEEITFDVIPVSISSSFDWGTPADDKRESGFFTICDGQVLCLRKGWEISMTEYEVPNGVKVIGGDAFYRVKGLSKITVPDSVEYISDYGFNRAESLTKLSLPSTLKQIGIRAFGYSSTTGELTYLKYLNITCRGCSPVLEEYMESLGKSYKAEHQNEGITVSYDCELGYMTVDRCTVCGHISGKEVFPAKGHNFEYIREGGTCTEDLMITKRCSVCGTVDGVEVTRAKGHIPNDEWTVISEPTCSEYGYVAKTCAVCGDIARKVRIEKLHHSLSDKAETVKEADCTERGVAGYVCGTCGKVFDAYEIPVKGHDFGGWIAITQAGEDGDVPSLCIRTCLLCGAVEGAWFDLEGNAVNGNYGLERGGEKLSCALALGACSDVSCLDYNSDGIISSSDTVTLMKTADNRRTLK